VSNKAGDLLVTLTHADEVRSARISPTGPLIVTASADNTARVWDPNGTLLATLRHDGDVRDAQFTVDGGLIVTASAGGTARVWEWPDPASAILALEECHPCARGAAEGALIHGCRVPQYGIESYRE
jgi:WD40 repeat protein